MFIVDQTSVMFGVETYWEGIEDAKGNALKTLILTNYLVGLNTATGILTKPIFAIGITRIYFNQRVRREEFESEMTGL